MRMREGELGVAREGLLNKRMLMPLPQITDEGVELDIPIGEMFDAARIRTRHRMTTTELDMDGQAFHGDLLGNGDGGDGVGRDVDVGAGNDKDVDEDAGDDDGVGEDVGGSDGDDADVGEDNDGGRDEDVGNDVGEDDDSGGVTRKRVSSP